MNPGITRTGWPSPCGHRSTRSPESSAAEYSRDVRGHSAIRSRVAGARAWSASGSGSAPGPAPGGIGTAGGVTRALLRSGGRLPFDVTPEHAGAPVTCYPAGGRSVVDVDVHVAA